MKPLKITLGSIVKLKINDEFVGMVISNTKHLDGGETFNVQWSPFETSSHYESELELTNLTNHRLGINSN